MTTKPEFKLETLAVLLNHSAEKYASNIACSFTDESHQYSYFSVKEKCEELSAMMSRKGVGASDRVLILSENRPEWTIAMFACTAYGRVMVPVLPDCSANEVNNILAHSEAKAAFVSPKQLAKISEENLTRLNLVVDLSDWHIISERENDEHAPCCTPSADDMAAILYTSGTSGNAKGVMLCHRNFCQNIEVGVDIQYVDQNDTWLSFLPMAHTYEFAISCLYPFYAGAHVYYLDKVPTPSLLIQAFKTIRPTIACAVPLIIEKIYKKSILPKINANPALKFLYKVCPHIVCILVGNHLKKTFGGRLRFFGIGGSKLDPEVERFLHRAHFPYAIGYGLTETAPLIAVTRLSETKVGSTGFKVKNVDIKLMDVDPETGLGELCVKGPNVMLGYYKDPVRTAEAFTEDGWFRTKDLAFIDRNGRIYIRGRIGNMIVGASGENIYPEEIETVINSLSYVEESLVKSENNRLIALVKLNDDFKADDMEQLKDNIQKYVNSSVSKASQLNAIRLLDEPFEKTATKKIRRFKY